MSGRHAMSRRNGNHDARGTDGTDGAVRPVTAERASFARAGRTIVDAASLVAAPGRALAVVGPSGSGKSSLLALVANLQQPDSGTVSGGDQRCGLILQGYGLVSVLTAAENVELALQAGVLGEMTRDEVVRRSAAVLADVGLDQVGDHLVDELSGGQQQRVAIARALAVEPQVVLADEFTAELDHDWKDRVIGLVLDVARRGGVVVIATHDLDLAARCDDLIRIVDGRLVDRDPPPEAA